ncbi:substrate-binding periplasmic protein [Zooshikella ganghwensis]|uniref:substrate-binding periplasmic protein n=1 Tax=Zooshikella ganghwensis TaxID=202772 RepID=UPI000424C971|nr:transporter substrate-binding domain-containing protein [Zooshikella ganghwensis]
MIFLRTLYLIASAASLSVSAQQTNLAGQTIHFCGDGAEWPPYHFWKRVNGEKTKEITGYDVDIITEILSKHQIKAAFFLPPWKRCLLEVEKNTKYQVALSSSYSDTRNTLFLYSNSYYSITPKFFYSTKRYPNGPPIIDSVKQLLSYEVCGLHSYNYTGFAEGIRNEDINMIAKKFDQVISLTLKNRCDLFLARYEILSGFASIGEDYLSSGDIKAMPIPHGKSDPFYLLISRQFKYAYELKGILDEGFAELERTGKMQLFLDKYIK